MPFEHFYLDQEKPVQHTLEDHSSATNSQMKISPRSHQTAWPSLKGRERETIEKNSKTLEDKYLSKIFRGQNISGKRSQPRDQCSQNFLAKKGPEGVDMRILHAAIISAQINNSDRYIILTVQSHLEGGGVVAICVMLYAKNEKKENKKK